MIMKKVNLSKFFKLTWAMLMIIGMAFVVTSCKDDDDDDIDPNKPIVLDGVYIKGGSTALVDFDVKGKMTVTRNEVTQTDRAQLLEKYVAIKAGNPGFNIVTVEGSVRTTYGPGADFAVVPEAERDNDEPKVDFWRGSYTETATAFTVPADGLYHVVIDTELKKVVIAPVKWGVIGGATPGGWGESTPFETPAFDLNTMTYTIPSITMGKDKFKFRYSNGWKIILDPDFDLGGGEKGIKVNTNLGGGINALIPGGADIPNDTYANYKITMTYTLGSPMTATYTFESEAEPLPEYPEAMYLVGAGTAYGWDTPGTKEDAIMHKIAGGAPSEGIYWKILYIEAGGGFKVSAADWKAPNLGFGDVTEYDANGVAVTDLDGNMDIAQSGMYMVVLNLRDNQTKLSITPAEVYGIGDAFTNWDEDAPANLFTVNNDTKTLVSPALPTSGNIRMYANHPWIPSWWNAEFNLYDGKIKYRNDGDDQEPVPGTAGNVITLSFDDNTGSIQ
ncbi:hypothetical protein MASR1M74_11410 [Lentimicrobium sp.]